MITELSQLDVTKQYTYADYLTWRIQERVELLWGRIMKMGPAPSLKHQQVSGALIRDFANCFRKKPCQVFHAPFDVRLGGEKGDDTSVTSVVQPDIVVVCDEKKLDEKGCNGAPDLVIEILSPSSSTKDLKHKYKLYEQSGVPEYWVVDPHDGTVLVFMLEENGKYRVNKPLTAEDKVESERINGLSIDLSEIFMDILKEPEEPYGKNVVRL
jgi:Uma2 family endonuclease